MRFFWKPFYLSTPVAAGRSAFGRGNPLWLPFIRDGVSAGAYPYNIPGRRSHAARQVKRKNIADNIAEMNNINVGWGELANPNTCRMMSGFAG
jgi:hypothetical protein